MGQPPTDRAAEARLSAACSRTRRLLEAGAWRTSFLHDNCLLLIRLSPSLEVASAEELSADSEEGVRPCPALWRNLVQAGTTELLVTGERAVDELAQRVGVGGEGKRLILPVLAELRDAPEGRTGFTQALVGQLRGAQRVAPDVGGQLGI